MQQKSFAVFSLIFISFVFLASSCGGSGAAKDIVDALKYDPGPLMPTGNGSDTDTNTGGAADLPTDYNGGGGDGDGDTNAGSSGYAFGGYYEGSCVVKAMGFASKSCKTSINIYHEQGGATFGLMGIMNVDMGFTKANTPVMTEPLNIVDGNLADPDEGSVVGNIGSEGFYVDLGGGDWMSFQRTDQRGFEYQGEYQDATYGTVSIRGSVQTLNE